MDKQKLYQLIEKVLSGKATAEEENLLAAYYNSFQREKYWNVEELGNVIETKDKIFAKIENRLRTIEKDAFSSDHQIGIKNRKNISFLRTGLAACVIGLVGLGSFYWVKKNPHTDISQKRVRLERIRNEVSSKSNNVLLRLADGSTICLNGAPDGRLISQGNTQISKVGCRVNYKTFSGTNEPVYNTLTTLTGGRYQIQLPDSTLVWLNAASSIRFPTAFAKKDRRVELTGEAYFEVAKNKAKPFIVSVRGSEVRVLGTHFNVMSYKNEPSLKTTLFEGSVQLAQGALINTIKPGQQAQLLKNGEVKILSRVSVDEVLAWKDGMFHFEGDDIATVMRELSRWYEVEVVYDANINDLFYAKIPRSVSLSKVLRLMELTGKVHFVINQNRIIVKA